MPTENELDVELPSIFIKQALMSPDPSWIDWRTEDFAQARQASQDLVVEHGSRFYRDLNVPKKALDPYIYWSGGTDGGRGIRFLLPRSLVTKKQSTFTIRSVRRFPAGRGSYSPLRPAYKNITRCLTGVGYTPIYSNGGIELLGHISQSRWVDDHQVSYVDETTEETVVELGIVIEMIYN